MQKYRDNKKKLAYAYLLTPLGVEQKALMESKGSDQSSLTLLISKQLTQSINLLLHWLSQGKPDGHQKWTFLDSPELDRAYVNTLASMDKWDTLVAHVELAA
jgi:hypothetical protein